MPFLLRALRLLEPVGFVAIAALAGAVTALLAYVTAQPLAPLGLAAGVGAVLLSLSHPVVVLYAAFALVPLELLSVSFGQAALSPTEALLVLTGLGWAAARLARGLPPWAPSPLGAPLFLFVLALVPGILIADEPFGVIKVLFIWSCLLLVYQMIVAEGDPHVVRTVLYMLAISAAVVGAIAIAESGGTAPELRGLGEGAAGRAQGSLGHPNTLATYEAMALPVALALAVGGPVRLRPLALACFAVIFAGLALSLSRGGLLAVGGALGVMLLWAPFRRTAIVAAALMAAFAVAGGNPLGATEQTQVLGKRLQSIPYSAGGVDPRFRVWDVTPRIIADHPLFGVGQNAFPDVAPRYNLLLGRDAAYTYEHAHNIPLTIAAELGLLGLAALTWVVIGVIRTLLTAARRAPPQRRPLVIAVTAALVALALQGMVDYTLRANVIMGTVFVLVGCVVVLSRDGQPDGASR